ncbi:MAG: hypothetical protein LBT97_03160 [Planctomycetota bacterium]|jgi:hypothetical protein|nr:hypothetical protein [Planctomycetota bacterium]
MNNFHVRRAAQKDVRHVVRRVMEGIDNTVRYKVDFSIRHDLRNVIFSAFRLAHGDDETSWPAMDDLRFVSLMRAVQEVSYE